MQNADNKADAPAKGNSGEMLDIAQDAIADWSGRDYVEAQLWEIEVRDVPPLRPDRSEGSRKLRATNPGPNPFIAGDVFTLNVVVVDKSVALDEADPTTETLQREAWICLQESYERPIELRFDQRQPAVAYVGGVRLPSQKATPRGTRPELSPTDLIERLSKATYTPELTADEIARLRAHLETPPSEARLANDPVEAQRRRKLAAILEQNQKRPGSQKHLEQDEQDVSHAEGFTSVRWFGTDYDFSNGLQSAAVRILWEAWKNGGHSVTQETIRQRSGSTARPFSLRRVFRNRLPNGKYEPHPAWGTMIQPTGKGCFKLAPPGEIGPRDS